MHDLRFGFYLQLAQLLAQAGDRLVELLDVELEGIHLLAQARMVNADFARCVEQVLQQLGIDARELLALLRLLECTHVCGSRLLGFGFRLGCGLWFRFGLRLGCGLWFRLRLELGLWLGFGFGFGFGFGPRRLLHHGLGFRLWRRLWLVFRFGRRFGLRLRYQRRFLVCRLAYLLQLIGKRAVDDNHADRIVRLGRELGGRRMLDIDRCRLDFAVVGHFESGIRLLDALFELRCRAHRFAGDDEVSHVVQFVERVLQQVRDAGRRFHAPVVDRDDQCLEFMTQVTHRRDAGHARAALERVQVAFELVDRRARGVVRRPFTERLVGRLE